MAVGVIAAGAVIAGAIGGLALALAKWHRDGVRERREAEERRQAERAEDRKGDKAWKERVERWHDEDSRTFAAIMAEVASLRASLEGLERQQARDVEGLKRQQARDVEALGKRTDDLGVMMGGLARRVDSVDARLASVEREVAGLKAQFAAFKEFVLPREAPAVEAAAVPPVEAATPAAATPGPHSPRQQAQPASEARRANPVGADPARP